MKAKKKTYTVRISAMIRMLGEAGLEVLEMRGEDGSLLQWTSDDGEGWLLPNGTVLEEKETTQMLTKALHRHNRNVRVLELAEHFIPMLKRHVKRDAITAEVPSSARLLLLLIPRKVRENLVGDLEEEFLTKVLPNYGLTLARKWYWQQVITSLCPIVWEQFKRVAGLVLLWKVVRR
jgi:hypothetical protein